MSTSVGSEAVGSLSKIYGVIRGNQKIMDGQTDRVSNGSNVIVKSQKKDIWYMKITKSLYMYVFYSLAYRPTEQVCYIRDVWWNGESPQKK